MLDIKYIRENPEKVSDGIAKKGLNSALVKELLAVDEKRRKEIQDVDDLRKKRNDFSETISKVAGTERAGALSHMKDVKNELGKKEALLKETEEEYTRLMYHFPNIPASDVPVGKDASGNVIVREVGEKTQFDFKPQDYIKLGETLDLIDTERAAKVSGSRFGYLKHEAPLLEFALIQFVFSRLIREDFITEIISLQKLPIVPKQFIPLVPPVMIRPEVFRGMGRLDPGQEEERYFLQKDNLYLVGSAEHTTGPMHMEETFEESSLPHRHVAFSTCFRREAGSYGKDTRGILRVHQFDKIELFSFAHPDWSNYEHELLLGIQERLMQELKIPYRVVFVCTGDMGWPDAKQYDIEAWMPGQNEYRETHSASNTTDFQARRLGIKFKNKKTGKSELVHMLNATAFAVGRTIIAILENYQNKDGSLTIPEALVPYMHGITKISPRK